MVSLWLLSILKFVKLLQGLLLITIIIIIIIIIINHNYNKILKSDWLSTALISALIGQFNRTVRVMPK